MLIEQATSKESRAKLQERMEFLRRAADGKKGAREQWIREQERGVVEGSRNDRYIVDQN